VFSLFRATGPFAQSNVRWYAWFTTAFNARFYYPILAILFLDLGLSLSQFVTLNAIWAATILLAEVPSGALADLIGRRKLLIAAAGLMVLEMTVLLIAPKDAGQPSVEWFGRGGSKRGGRGAGL
jgi:MFS family permease